MILALKATFLLRDQIISPTWNVEGGFKPVTCRHDPQGCGCLEHLGIFRVYLKIDLACWKYAWLLTSFLESWRVILLTSPDCGWLGWSSPMWACPKMSKNDRWIHHNVTMAVWMGHVSLAPKRSSASWGYSWKTPSHGLNFPGYEWDYIIIYIYT